jgi:hypothetical protein
MRCLGRLGCLIVVLALGVVAFLTRDRWLPYVPGRGARVEATVTSSAWAPLSPAGAQRTRDALAKLASPRGPVFVTLDGSDVASYIFTQMAKDLPVAADSLSARVDLDQVRLRASMKMSDLGSSATGVIGLLLGERERVEMGGTLRVIGPGIAEFRVTDARIRDVSLPSAVISRLVRPLTRKNRPPGLDDNGIPISIPSYIGDVRVANGKITLYKNVQ